MFGKPAIIDNHTKNVMLRKGINYYTQFLLVILTLAVFWFLGERNAQAATLTIYPAQGTFTVGSTFDVTVFIDTQKANINTIRTFLTFPPDKLQVIPRTLEQSIFAVYSSPPRFDNQTGIVDLQGGIPGGINVSNGQVVKFVFRVKAVGNAVVRFRDESKVLANDGLGTDVLGEKRGGIYELILPPPAGPIVVSKTHPDQAKWYANTSPVLTWSAEESGVEGYSYVLNNDPVDIPDDISEGAKAGVTYKNLGDGIQYFHIKSLRRGNWGGVTDFALNIDSTPPSEFPIEIIPGKRTTRRQPIIEFTTTDVSSGLDHYELKILPLSVSVAHAQTQQSQPFFIEVLSPYITPELELGSYDVIIRAHDKAGNVREETERLKIVSLLFKTVTGRGLEFKSKFIIPWLWFWIITGIFVVFLVYAAWRLKKWHDRVHLRRLQRELPEHVNAQLQELRKFRQKYGKLAVLLLLVSSGVFFSVDRVVAQQIELAPPFISTISKDISNEEIFYIGGKTDSGNAEVIIYLQNLQDGQTFSQIVTSDKNGEWFYGHNTFLASGNYLLWGQTRIGDQISPPSPQIQMSVKPTAIQFGASRISLEFLYLILVILLFVAVLGLMAYIIFHAYHGRKKHLQFLDEVKRAEESVRRGFAVLRRDIEAELALVRHGQAKSNKRFLAQEKEKEEQLLKDLAAVEQYIGEEIWEIEKVEKSG